MKRKRRIYIYIIAVLGCVYFALLFLMLHAESADPDSSIHTFMDALWYSIVTLTTVGYGDVTPVTTTGHVIGIIFLFMSAGILITLAGTLISFLTSEGFPLMLLSCQKRKNWYYFADMGLESDTLAKHILEEDPNGVIICGQSKSSVDETPDYPCLFINVSPERIANLKRGEGERCKVFLMKENDIGVNQRAVNIAQLPVDVYARTVSGEDEFSGNIHFFHSYDCCAREYWRLKPLRSTERQIVLIGFGYYGRAILERAILTNVLSPDHPVVYHIFGDVGNFLHIHPGLKLAFSIQEISGQKDSLIFHENSWTMEHDLFEAVDRIIICDDDEQEGWDILWHLRRYYHFHARVDLRSNRMIPGLSHFGTNDSIYTPEHVLRTTLNQVAVAMNDLYRSSHPQGALDWEHLDDYLRQSKIAASEHVFLKVRILLRDEDFVKMSPDKLAGAYRIYQQNIQNPACLEQYRRIEHLRWLRFYAYYNWTYGPVHNSELRQDPRICRYEELPMQLQEYFDDSWALIGRLKVKYEP